MAAKHKNMKKINRSENLRRSRAQATRGSKKKIMSRLAYHYLDVAGIELEEGEVYDANKISRGLSAVYKQAGNDEEKAKDMITVAGEFFNSKNLSWTPIAVWRDWEMIRVWRKNDKSKQDVSERRKL